MKVRLEIDESITDDEVVIRCAQLSDEIVELQRRISDGSPGGMRLEVTKVYMTNAGISPEGAKMEINCSFCEITVYYE